VFPIYSLSLQYLDFVGVARRAEWKMKDILGNYPLLTDLSVPQTPLVQDTILGSRNNPGFRA